jgi:N-acyl-L-homoserine lactone synthetase
MATNTTDIARPLAAWPAPEGALQRYDPPIRPLSARRVRRMPNRTHHVGGGVREPTTIDWKLFAPPGDTRCDWLDDIREFRARVLYDDGSRPSFRKNDGRYADSDPLDKPAHHLVARVAGAVVGCVRLLPVREVDVCLTEDLVGVTMFAAMLRSLGVHRSQTMEGGRWVVDPMHRAARLGVRLAAGGVAIARASGYRLLCCPAGTARNQDRVLARLGLSAVLDFPLIPVPHLDDRLRVMHVLPSGAPPRLRELMVIMATELKMPRAPQG